jgi:uncharacterized protein YbcI
MSAQGETNPRVAAVSQHETRSQGEIEAAVCDGISRFQQEFIGRGPRDIHAHLLGTLLVVRLQGVLTPAERQLISPAGKAVEAGAGTAAMADYDNGNGRALLKQVRAHMVATGRPRLETLVETATGVPLVSVHHDISTVTGEEVLVFSLATAPNCRPRRNTTRKTC